jgi:hypothetical protein
MTFLYKKQNILLLICWVLKINKTSKNIKIFILFFLIITLLTNSVYKSIIGNTIDAKRGLKIILFTNCTIIRKFETFLAFF